MREVDGTLPPHHQRPIYLSTYLRPTSKKSIDIHTFIMEVYSFVLSIQA